MTEEEIVKEALSKSIEANEKMLRKKTDLIGVNELYADAVEMAEHISYHAVKGKFPEKLFSSRSPNETEKEAKYIKDNYKQYTLPVFIDYISTITRPFGDGNWSINYVEDQDAYKTADKTFQKYVEQELPIYGSLENFVKFILPTIKSIDANGYLTVRPKEIAYKLNEEDEQVVDSEKLYEPTVFYFESKTEVYCKQHHYYLFLSKEKSVVKFGGKEERTGAIFELYTKEAVYFITQVGAKNDNEFKFFEFYRHNLNECPVHQLMGVPNLRGEKILWQSPFLYSVDLLDIVTMNANWLQASINKCAYPIPVMFGRKCTFKDAEGHECIEGDIHIDGVPHHKCSNCNGSGLVSRLSALGTFLLNPSNKFEEGETSSTQEPLKFVSPEVHTLEFMSDKVDRDTAKARAILHLRDKTKSVQTSQDNTTATEVYDDSKAMYSFVKPISDQIFTLYEWCANMIGLQRYGESFKAPEFSYPKTFDFKSPEDYLTDISNALKNNLPPSFIQTILMQYINSFYGDNAKTTGIFRLVMSADRLFGLSQDEINMQLARGTVAKWEQILHTSVLLFINESVNSDPKFLDKNIEDQIKILEDMAKVKQLEIEGSPIEDVNGTTLPAASSQQIL